MLDYGYNPGDIGYRSFTEPVRMPIVAPPPGTTSRRTDPVQPVQPPSMMLPPPGPTMRWAPPQPPVAMPWISPRTAFPRLGQSPRPYSKTPRFTIGSEAILALLNSL